MKSISGLILFIAFLTAAISCEKEKAIMNTSLKNQDLILGNWIYARYDSVYCVYSKANTLDPNNYGYSFNEGGNFVERKNAGWCMTPPSFANFSGSWTFEKDSIISIHVGYWNGQEFYRFRIGSINSRELKVEYI